MKASRLVTPLIFLALGILSLIVGVVTYNRDKAFYGTAEHATATITRYVPDPDTKAPDFCPEFEFTTQAGQTIHYVGDQCISEPDPSRIGQTEEAYYSPDNPQSIYSISASSATNDLILGAVGCVGFPLIGLATLGLNIWRDRRKRRR
jgi:hypothetical protein